MVLYASAWLPFLNLLREILWPVRPQMKVCVDSPELSDQISSDKWDGKSADLQSECPLTSYIYILLRMQAFILKMFFSDSSFDHESWLLVGVALPTDKIKSVMLQQTFHSLIRTFSAFLDWVHLFFLFTSNFVRHFLLDQHGWFQWQQYVHIPKVNAQR